MFAVKFNRAMAPYGTGDTAAWKTEDAPDYVRALKGGYATRVSAEKMAPAKVAEKPEPQK